MIILTLHRSGRDSLHDIETDRSAEDLRIFEGRATGRAIRADNPDGGACGGHLGVLIQL